MSNAPTEPFSPKVAAQQVDRLGTLACILLALITVAFAAFRFAPVLPVGASRNVDRAFFSSVNLATLTGFTQSFASVSDYPSAGHWMIGVISFLSAVTILGGSSTFLARVLGFELGLLRSLIISVVGLGALSLLGIPLGEMNAVSAVTGLGLVAGSESSRLASIGLVTLSAPAGIGLILFLVAARSRLATRRIELLGDCWTLLALIYLGGVLLLRLGGATWLEASLLSIDARSLGSGAVPLTSGGPSGKWAAAALMILGAGPGALAGGLSVLPLAVLYRTARNSLRGGVMDPLVGVALAWIALFFAGLLGLVLALSATQPQLPGDRMLLLAISALCNVGLSHDPVSLSQEGLYLMSTAMVFGRLLPLVMLCWMASTSGEPVRTGRT